MCKKSSTTMTDDPHLCIPRTSQPSVASLVIHWIVIHAVSGLGW